MGFGFGVVARPELGHRTSATFSTPSVVARFSSHGRYSLLVLYRRMSDHRAFLGYSLGWFSDVQWLRKTQ